MATFTLRAAKTKFSKLVARAEKGEEIVIKRGNKPVARLVALDVPAYVRRRRAFGSLKGKLKLPDSFFFGPLDEKEIAAWEGREERSKNAR